MGVAYKPGIWARQYRRLPRAQKDVVIKETNRIFREQTGVARALDPKKDQVLCWKWLEIRDQVMAKRAQSRKAAAHGAGASSSGTVWDLSDPFHMVRVDRALDLINATAETLAEMAAAPWMLTARAELGEKEVPGRDKNERIIEYIRTCESLWEDPTYTWADKKKSRPRISDFEVYFSREGEEVVKWCSAFVNWCMEKVGITGTNDAEAKSWANWGRRLDEPAVGAIVCVSYGSKPIDHVAFIDQVDGEWKLLGGNQKRSNGKGYADRVSHRPYNPKRVKAIRWPD